VPKKKNHVDRAQAPRPKPFYKYPAPNSKPVGRASPRAEKKDFVHAKPIPSAHFELREDGSVVGQASSLSQIKKGKSETGKMPVLQFSSESPFIRLYRHAGHASLRMEWPAGLGLGQQ